MSRIGAKPISIPAGVSVQYVCGRVLIKSIKAKREIKLHSSVTCSISNNQLMLFMKHGGEINLNKIKPMWGTYRSNINNIIRGMVSDFSVNLEIKGIGYKAECDNNFLTLYLGYSHNIKYRVPKNIRISCEKPTHLVISGMEKQRVYAVASDICKIRKYDPYKGKGVTIVNRFLLRKVISKKK